MSKKTASQIVCETLGMNIARLREEHGYSQSEFARRFSIDRSFLNQIESGKQNASISKLVKIADGLDVPITALFAGLEEKPPSAFVEYEISDLPK